MLAAWALQWRFMFVERTQQKAVQNEHVRSEAEMEGALLVPLMFIIGSLCGDEQNLIVRDTEAETQRFSSCDYI